MKSNNRKRLEHLIKTSLQLALTAVTISIAGMIAALMYPSFMDLYGGALSAIMVVAVVIILICVVAITSENKYQRWD